MGTLNKIYEVYNFEKNCYLCQKPRDMDATIIRKIKSRDITKEELADYLLRNHSVVEIVNKLAEYMWREIS